MLYRICSLFVAVLPSVAPVNSSPGNPTVASSPLHRNRQPPHNGNRLAVCGFYSSWAKQYRLNLACSSNGGLSNWSRGDHAYGAPGGQTAIFPAVRYGGELPGFSSLQIAKWQLCRLAFGDKASLEIYCPYPERRNCRFQAHGAETLVGIPSVSHVSRMLTCGTETSV